MHFRSENKSDGGLILKRGHVTFICISISYDGIDTSNTRYIGIVVICSIKRAQANMAILNLLLVLYSSVRLGHHPRKKTTRMSPGVAGLYSKWFKYWDSGFFCNYLVIYLLVHTVLVKHVLVPGTIERHAPGNEPYSVHYQETRYVDHL